MTLLKSGINLLSGVKNFITESSNLTIFAPYVKLDSLTSLLDNCHTCRAIVVRWEFSDMLAGSSDVEVYKYCSENGITLYRNPRLHLKAFINEYREALIATANISSRGLDIPKHWSHNHEVAIKVPNLDLQDRWFFEKIINESTVVNEQLYSEINELIKQHKDSFPQLPSIPIVSPDKSFLISSLPMTYNVRTLLRISESGEHVNETELNCTIHDLVLYEIPIGLPADDTIRLLKEAFFKHPFIKAFLKNIESNEEIFFGAAKAWIQKNCTDVPTPRRWEITANIQILYRWIVDLSDGKYQVDQPNISERLFLVK